MTVKQFLENRCRPQSARLHTLWTAVLIGIAKNPVFDCAHETHEIAVRFEMKHNASNENINAGIR